MPHELLRQPWIEFAGGTCQFGLAAAAACAQSNSCQIVTLDGGTVATYYTGLINCSNNFMKNDTDSCELKFVPNGQTTYYNSQ